MMFAFDINSSENQEKIEYYQNNMTQEEFNLLVNDLHNQSNENSEGSRDCTMVYITCEGGAWQTEVSWEYMMLMIFYCFRRGTYAGSYCFEPGGYMLHMMDSYGDGWNGNKLYMGFDEFYLSSGSYGMEVFYIDGGDDGNVDDACGPNQYVSSNTCVYHARLEQPIMPVMMQVVLIQHVM